MHYQLHSMGLCLYVCYAYGGSSRDVATCFRVLVPAPHGDIVLPVLQYWLYMLLTMAYVHLSCSPLLEMSILLHGVSCVLPLVDVAIAPFQLSQMRWVFAAGLQW